ncbi:hypothetical protein [Bacillus cereus]|uniref:hypothetical protein n=1 Tax=Bacillus cereus TaxID=1396 RepID=UPI00397EEF86
MYSGNPLVPITGVASVGILDLLDAPLIIMATAVALAFATNFALIIRTKRKTRENT